MLDGLLPDGLIEKISNLYLWEYIQEIRIRKDKPVMINYKGSYKILSDKSNFSLIPIIANSDLINYIMSVATKGSLYAFNHQIKCGYITTDSGIRIGICGTVVYDKNEISTIKNITSLNIRIPHQVHGCSEQIIDLICQNGNVKNTLIVSPPGAGKTTLLRDLVLKISNDKKINNILMVDERCELAGLVNGYFENGDFVDVLTGSSKQYAFDESVKTMNPSVIVCDEISSEKDINSVIQASRAGVSVIATAHSKNLIDLKQKRFIGSCLTEKVFERIIVLSKRNGVGTIEAVYDENLKGIYIPYLL